MTTPPALSPDERAAARAFLQRAEVRLSTLHRVGSALLSGAGLMVLLPVIVRDSLDSVIRSLLIGELDGPRLLLVGSVLACVALPLIALWLLLKELTRFYFNAVQIHGEGSPFLPRYTLTGLKLPSGELSETNAAALDDVRIDPQYLRLIVPDNDRYRRRVDEQHRVYHGTEPQTGLDDVDRAELLLEFAASHDRSLLGEVAKVEYGLARHVLRTQIVVLRYTKALIALISTAAAVYVASGALQGHPRATTSDLLWVGGAMVAWAPWVMLGVASPVRWLSRLLKRSDSSVHLVRSDRELTHFEDITVRLAVAGWALASVAVVWTLVAETVSPRGTASAWTVLIGSALAVAVALFRWDGRRAGRRLIGRHRALAFPPVPTDTTTRS